MTKNAEILFALIQAALKQETYSIDLSDELYQLAKENGVSGMIYPAIDPLHDFPQILSKFKHDYYEFIQWDTVQKKTIQEIRELFNQTSIQYIFLKGSYLKNIYPQSYMRSMGDIDILVKPDKMRLIHQILAEAGYENWANSTAHDCFRKNRKVYLEIHPSLDNEFDTKYSALFENVWEETQTVSKFEYEFQADFMVGYLLYHMVKHLASSGIGVRNILDVGLFLKTVDTELTRETLFQRLEPIHLWTFFQNICYLSKVMFHFEYRQDYLSGYEIDPEFTEGIIQFILTSGVHGQGEEHNPYLSGISRQSLSENSIASSRFKYILQLIFPPYHKIRGSYPYLEKSKILLPVAWMERAFRLLFKRTKSTVKKIKKLNIKNEDIQDVERLYSKLGL